MQMPDIPKQTPGQLDRGVTGISSCFMNNEKGLNLFSFHFKRQKEFFLSLFFEIFVYKMYVCLCKFLQTTIKFCVKWIIKLEFLQEFVLHFGFGHATIRKGAASVAALKASTFLNEVVTLVQKCSLGKTRGKFSSYLTL